MYKAIAELFEYINRGTSPWHVVEVSAAMLEKEGFERLSMSDIWRLRQGGKYFVDVYGSSLFAFVLGDDFSKENSSNILRICAAHTDFPAFRLKPHGAMTKEGYGVLNVEGYGGMIVYSWLDRPLSMAGKVAVRSGDPFKPNMIMVDFARPLMTIPSLAIHMDRKVNEGKEFNKQKHMMPLTAFFCKDGYKDYIEDCIAREIGIAAMDIMSYDLNMYICESPCQLGMAGELVSAPRIDNLSSCIACLKGIISTKEERKGLSIAALFDNEEIGSRTKQGAASTLLSQIVERIYFSVGMSRSDMWRDAAGGFMLSADVAHGIHPHYLEKADSTNRPTLNGGVVIKVAASQSYACDAEAIATVKGLCEANGIDYQIFVNRNDIPGGSTLGSIASAVFPIRTMDIGVALLGMHSARETMGAVDQDALNRLMEAFFCKIA